MARDLSPYKQAESAEIVTFAESTGVDLNTNWSYYGGYTKNPDNHGYNQLDLYPEVEVVRGILMLIVLTGGFDICAGSVS